MTRQKKELENKLIELDKAYAAELELSCGFCTSQIAEAFEPAINDIQEKLAALRHYSNVLDMFYDDRYLNGAAYLGDKAL